MRLLADHAGEVVTHDRPRVSATLPETGERFQGTFMPVVARPAFAIRKRPEVVFTLDDYVEGGMMSAAQAEVIRAAARARENLLIVSGTGSGKTTLANAILAEPAFAGDRVVLIEDTAELQCSAADQIQMLTSGDDDGPGARHPAPAAGPDCDRGGPRRLGPRSPQGVEHRSSRRSRHAHANSAVEGLSRLEDLIGEVTQRIPHRAIGQAIDLVIHIARTPGGRRVSDIVRVTGWGGGGGYEMQAA